VWREAETNARNSLSSSSVSNGGLARDGLEIGPLEHPAGPDGLHTAFVSDPDGYRIELVQCPPGHPDGITEQAKEQARKAREAADAYNRHLDKLAQREDAAWELAGDLIGTRRPGEYDKAVTLLVDLRALSQREGRADAFAERFRVLREQHPRKPSLLERFEKARLTP
jgi:hypothetical protein